MHIKKPLIIIMILNMCSSTAQEHRTEYKWQDVNGINIFYRVAGDRTKPTIILFHGTPSSSVMYQKLIDLLKEDFYLIAPDYPAHGYSDTPDPKSYEYSFENIAKTMEHFLDSLKISKYSIYMQDYGAPIGFRIALNHPERVQALLIQNGNAYIDGFPSAQDMKGELQTYWRDKNPEYEKEWMEFYESLNLASADKWKHNSYVSPDRRALDVAVMKKPGTLEIFRDLWFDYGNNVKQYPKWQDYLRKYTPPTLVMWGRKDGFFTVPGALAYLRDVPEAEVHILDGGHWLATDDNPVLVADLITNFFKNNKNLKQL